MGSKTRSCVEMANQTLKIIKAISADPYAKAQAIADSIQVEKSQVRRVQKLLTLRLEARAEDLICDYQKMLLTSLPIERRAERIANIALKSKNHGASLKAIEDADKLGGLRKDKIDATLSNPDGSPILSGIKLIRVEPKVSDEQ